MGANFATYNAGPLSQTRDQLNDWYKEACRAAAWSCGNEYSGEINMTSGLGVDSRAFPSVSAAEDYLDETCQKWGNAIAVRVVPEDGSPGHWRVGAICAS